MGKVDAAVVERNLNAAGAPSGPTLMIERSIDALFVVRDEFAVVGTLLNSITTKVGRGGIVAGQSPDLEPRRSTATSSSDPTEPEVRIPGE